MAANDNQKLVLKLVRREVAQTESRIVDVNGIVRQILESYPATSKEEAERIVIEIIRQYQYGGRWD